jgi:putative N6-adenine-specific DNA methylase
LEKETPLQKRIKRHIIGRTHSFFVAVTPGLEALCLDELKSLPLSATAFSLVKGGIEFEGRLQDCYIANLHLRIANRVLMRIAGFKASNFSRLEKKLSSFPWELYISHGIIPEINTSTKHSRLYHKDAIDERIKSSIVNRRMLAEFHKTDDGPCTSFTQQVFARVVDDLFTISLDSSGDLLYKRGLKDHNAAAPIRETLAAAALRMAGFKGNEPLLDPMSGAGTFSIEAAMIATETPPGLFRDFAFMDWPCFRPERWKHIRRESEIHIMEPGRQLIAASEKDERLFSALKERIKNFAPLREITVLNMDFFDMKRKDIMIIFNTDLPGLVILNPPYGVRLGTKRKSRELFRNIIGKLSSDFKGWRYALFVHDKELIREVPFKKTSILLDHGGLKLTLLTGTV